MRPREFEGARFHDAVAQPFERVLIVDIEHELEDRGLHRVQLQRRREGRDVRRHDVGLRRAILAARDGLAQLRPQGGGQRLLQVRVRRRRIIAHGARHRGREIQAYQALIGMQPRRERAARRRGRGERLHHGVHVGGNRHLRCGQHDRRFLKSRTRAIADGCTHQRAVAVNSVAVVRRLRPGCRPAALSRLESDQGQSRHALRPHGVLHCHLASPATQCHSVERRAV